MEARWYKPRQCYRVWIPARLSENGKWCRRFFTTKAEAEEFIFEIKRRGSVQLAELSLEEMHVLGVIRQSDKYEPRLLLEAWRRFETEGTGNGANLTGQQPNPGLVDFFADPPYNQFAQPQNRWKTSQQLRRS